MKNKLYLLIKSSIILGSVLSLPLQITAETTTYSSESAIRISLNHSCLLVQQIT